MTLYVVWVFFALLAVAAVACPWIGVVAYMGYVTLGTDTHYGWLISPVLSTQRLLAAAVFAGLILNPLARNPIALTGRWALASFTGFILVAFVSVLGSFYPEKSWWFWDHLWKIWVMVLLAVRLLDSPFKIQAAVWTIVLAQGCNAAIVNREYFHLGFSETRDAGRHALDNNTYALSTLPPMALAAALAVYCKPIWQRLLAGGVLALQVHQMILLDSRGGLASMLIMFFIGFVLMPKRWDTMGGAVVVLSLGLMLAGSHVVKRFESIFVEDERRDESAASRFELWDAGWRIMNDHRLFGVGLFAGERFVPKYSRYKDEKEKALHNLALDIGTGTGYAGLAFYLAFFGFGWLCAMKLRRLAPRPPPWAGVAALGVAAGLPAYWAGSMFSSSALIEAPYLAVVVAVSSYSLARRHLDEWGELLPDDYIPEPPADPFAMEVQR